MVRLLVSIFLFFSFALAPAYGCSVCGFAEDGTREAFLATTALLTLVPLLVIGGGVTYLVRLAKRRDLASEAVPVESKA